MTDPLGVPTPEEWAATAEVIGAHRGARTAGSLSRQIADDSAAVKAAWPNRWPSGLEPPWPLRPGDLLALRGFAAWGDTQGDGRPPHAGAVAACLLDGLPFWLPGRVAWGLAHTDVPTDPDGEELDAWAGVRLPAPVVSVWWAGEMSTGGLDPRPPWLHDWQAERRRGAQLAVDRTVPAPFLPVASWHDGDGTPDRVSVVGVVLLADQDGVPQDEVIWVVAAQMLGGSRDGGWIFVPVPGLRSRAGWWQMLEAITAIVAWGDWVPDAPLVVRNRGKLRRLNLAGIDLDALGPVRVLDARRRSDLGEPRAEPTGAHASPATHIRRGHLRRQRVGPRDEGRVELRWIAPTIVNPDGAPDPRPSVLVLPPPERSLGNRINARRAAGRT